MDGQWTLPDEKETFAHGLICYLFYGMSTKYTNKEIPVLLSHQNLQISQIFFFFSGFNIENLIFDLSPHQYLNSVQYARCEDVHVKFSIHG